MREYLSSSIVFLDMNDAHGLLSSIISNMISSAICDINFHKFYNFRRIDLFSVRLYTNRHIKIMIISHIKAKLGMQSVIIAHNAVNYDQLNPFYVISPSLKSSIQHLLSSYIIWIRWKTFFSRNVSTWCLFSIFTHVGQRWKIS